MCFSVTVRCHLLESIAGKRNVYLHWFDNFARAKAANTLWLSKETFMSCLWTAHAVKIIPMSINIDHVRNNRGEIISALPSYKLLQDTMFMEQLADALHDIDINLLPKSLCENRNVCRIPLKPVGINAKETHDLELSMDGLRFDFYDALFV
jgi:hypothetical protein